MPIFQQTILETYIKNIPTQKLEQAWQTFTKHFHNPEVQENIQNAKEEQYQEGFLKDLFVQVFGYVLNPNPNFNLTTELKNIRNAQKTDGAILQNGSALAVIELKSTNLTNLDRVEKQAFGYKNNQPRCVYVITSNFEKLRFYIDNAVDFEEFNLFRLTKEEFAKLWLCLASDSLLKNLPQKIKTESISKGEDITLKLYKDYKAFRDELFADIQKRNKGYDKLTLFKKTQKLLDRFLFAFFAEDKLLIPPNSVRKVIQQWTDLRDKYDAYFPLYERFKKFFGYINEGHESEEDKIFAYNGGLFAPDDLLDNLKIEDGILYKHTFKIAEYNFNKDVSVNILGHIFEHSLNEIEELQAQNSSYGGRGARKQDGIFYTPKYITQYIVEETVGKLCAEKKEEFEIVEEDYKKGRKGRRKTTIKNLQAKLEKYRTWLLDIKICDPACGSGAFLNQALEFLIEEHKYIDELQAKLLGQSIVLREVENEILENNIFGVDLNIESVEIAKLSLWLRTAKQGRKLLHLRNNIKVGNSLIDDPNIAGEKAFVWAKEFPTIFQKGGFDVIIGNPPWVSLKGKEGHHIPQKELDFLLKEYQGNTYMPNLFEYFIRLGLKLSKNNGFFSMIVPDRFGLNSVFKNLRADILTSYNLLQIVYKWKFPKIITDTMTFVIKKNQASSKVLMKNTPEDKFVEYLPSDFKPENNFNFKAFKSMKEKNLVQKVLANKVELGTICNSTSGLGAKSHLITEEKESSQQIEVLKGKSIERYVTKEILYFEFKPQNITGRTRDEEKLSKKEKIVLRKTGNRLISTKNKNGSYPEQSLYFLYDFDKKYTSEYLLCLLNSKLMTWLYLNYFVTNLDSTPQLKNIDLDKFPIPKISLQEQAYFIEKANMMLALNQEMYEKAKQFLEIIKSDLKLKKISRKQQRFYEYDFTTFLEELAKQKISISLPKKAELLAYFKQSKKELHNLSLKVKDIDIELDAMVYKLYNLTEKEIEIIESGH